MRVVIAPQAFKGSIGGLAVARAMRDGLLRVAPHAEAVLLPVADGGDGTLETLVEGTGGSYRDAEVAGPLGEPVVARWGSTGDGRTAVIEMARSSGLALVLPARRDPMVSTTRGLGDLVIRVLDLGFRRFLVGIGGSATNDAGAGMAQALGARLLDADGGELPPGGGALARLARIDLSGLDPRVRGADFEVACDVTNPLTGPEGATAVYGPQKGATAEMVARLDAALANFARVAMRDLGADVERLPGGGAAGGLGAGMVAFLGATLRPGVDLVLDLLGFDRRLEGADLVITGEGSLDYQSVYDKAPIGVARRAGARGIPVIAIAGGLGEGFQAVHAHGIDAAFPITLRPMTLEEASARAAELIADATEQALRLMRAGRRVFGG